VPWAFLIPKYTWHIPFMLIIKYKKGLRKAEAQILFM